MKKIALSLLLLLGIALHAQAQISTSYAISYGSYQMKDMKNLLETVRTSPAIAPYQAINVNNFGSAATHTFSLAYRHHAHQLGLVAALQSTGGKLSRIDYSGEYALNIDIDAIRAGIVYRNYFYTMPIAKETKLALFAEISPSLLFSTTHYHQYLYLPQYKVEETNQTYHSTSLSIVPQVGLQFTVSPALAFNTSIGYEADLGSSITALNSKTNWSGIRASAGIAITWGK